MKIINPQAKIYFSIIDWHGVTERFKTPLQLKLKLISTLEQYVPPASSIETFSVGYFCGRPQAKKWIVSSDDLDAMYLGGAESFFGVMESQQIHPISTKMMPVMPLLQNALHTLHAKKNSIN